MDGSIFISYRRGADSGFAGRLYDRLEHSFGRQRVFMDVDSIAPGEDFVAVLEARVAECDVLLALIGHGWLTATDAAGRLRLDNPADFVRIEIAAALAQGKGVIPVVIDDVSFPRAEDLPEEINALARLQAIRIRHDRFRDDATRLVGAVEKALADADPPIASTKSASSGRGGGLLIPVSSAPPDFSVFRDVEAPWCPEMVALPASEFQMGSPKEQERPQHRVMIGYRFAIGRHPVTFAEYDHFCDVTKRERPQDEGWGRGRRPVINVSWFDAQAYCEWLAKETGRLYRLPSEAEWEYACRAGTTTSYSWGDEITPEKANYGSKTIEVGVYPANSWGLCDMHGNVWEWVEDVWHESYYGAHRRLGVDGWRRK